MPIGKELEEHSVTICVIGIFNLIVVPPDFHPSAARGIPILYFSIQPYFPIQPLMAFRRRDPIAVSRTQVALLRKSDSVPLSGPSRHTLRLFSSNDRTKWFDDSREFPSRALVMLGTNGSWGADLPNCLTTWGKREEERCSERLEVSLSGPK